MKDISIFPGDYIWTVNGTHEIGENGFALKSKENLVVSLTDELFQFVYPKITHERECSENMNVGSEKQKLWVLAKSDLVQGEKGTFIASIFPGFYKLKQSPVMCDKTYAMCTDIVSFITENVPKRHPKIHKTEIEKEVMENFTETVYIDEPVYDQTLNAYTIQKVPKELTGERNVYDTFDLYDNGVKVGTHKVKQMKKITNEVPVFDEKGEPVIEDVVDENGNTVMEPKIPTKYISETGEERTLENYLQQGSSEIVYKAIEIDAIIINVQSY